MAMRYLEAEATLVAAEKIAWDRRDFDTLARGCTCPLQGSLRPPSADSRCGEGMICLDLLARGPDDHLDGEKIVEYFPHGQILVAGWDRSSQRRACPRFAKAREACMWRHFCRGLSDAIRQRIVIVPLPEVRLPGAAGAERGCACWRNCRAQCVIMSESELPHGEHARGNTETYGRVMALWEKLHTPFLAARPDMQVDPIQKIEGYRKTIRVDYACELAHQKLADVARNLGRGTRQQAG